MDIKLDNDFANFTGLALIKNGKPSAYYLELDSDFKQILLATIERAVYFAFCRRFVKSNRVIRVLDFFYNNLEYKTEQISLSKIEEISGLSHQTLQDDFKDLVNWQEKNDIGLLDIIQLGNEKTSYTNRLKVVIKDSIMKILLTNRSYTELLQYSNLAYRIYADKHEKWEYRLKKLGTVEKHFFEKLEAQFFEEIGNRLSDPKIRKSYSSEMRTLQNERSKGIHK